MDLRIPTKGNKKLEKLLQKVYKDQELETYWQCANVIAINRLGFTDHGPTHVKIVANIGLKMLRLLIDAGITPGIVKDYKMTNEDAEVVVALSSILHDVGHIVHRENHHAYSVALAMRFLDRLLVDIYDVKSRAIITSEVLHAITAHNTATHPLTLEAGIVRVADALDMEKGRARIPFNAGEINIHSVSAMAIDKITIEKGEDKPIRVIVDMCNSAGVFQIDDLLGKKIKGSGLEDYLKIVVQVRPEGETRILDKFEF